MKIQSFLASIFLMLLNSLPMTSQNLLPELQKIFGEYNVTALDSSAFKFYYKINVELPVDHNDSKKGYFMNRILLGFNITSDAVVMESAAYGITKKYVNSNYKTELTELLNTNQLIVEHRYFGTSIPDSTTFKHLTYKQVSDDFHQIRQMLQSIFPGKWIATGSSKGGDAVLAYKFYYPDDVDGTVAYVTSLTTEKEDHRFEKFIAEKSKTDDGKKLYEDQLYLLKNKKRLLPAFIDYVQEIKKYMADDFITYDWELMYDYGVLDLQNIFWQQYGDYKKFEVEMKANYDALIEMDYNPKIAKYNDKDKLIYMLNGIYSKKMRPHYFQAFSQGGYYGYDEKPFKKYLKQSDYSLEFFAGEKTSFDASFRVSEKKFTETDMENVLFILAETDPWSVICPINLPPGKDNLKLVLTSSTHSVQLKDFDEQTRKLAIQKLKVWISEK